MTQFQPGHRIGAWAAMLAIASLVFPAYGAEVREFYIETVHFDGNATTAGDADHPAEAFPDSTLPAKDGGLSLTPPNPAGNWKMRAFAFVPSQLMVGRGDSVRLHFVGVHGVTHPIHIEGKDVNEKFTLTRGKVHTVNFTAKTAGIIEIECYAHLPSMRGQVVVLP